MSRSWRFAPPAGIPAPLRSVNSLARSLGFVWVGLLAFVVYPPHASSAMLVQIIGYSVAGLGLLCWTLLDYLPTGARYRGWALPVALAMIAGATGCAAAVNSIGGLFLIIYGFLAALAAGSDTDLRVALAVVATGVLATDVAGLVFGGSVGELLGLPAVIASGLLLGCNRGAYRIRAEQSAVLLVQREQLQVEQRRADLLDERTRIAREIHDVLAHSLGALAIQIQAARSVLTDRGDIDRASELLAAAQRMASEGLTETRRAVHALRVDTRPLADELAKATDTYSHRYRVAASFVSSGAAAPVPADATVAILRIAQEALVNAAKHAAGQAVTVRLDFAGHEVRLTVCNELTSGAPCEDEPSAVSTVNAGYGLTGMRERLRILNGTLTAGSADGQWVVTAQLPLAQAESLAS